MLYWIHYHSKDIHTKFAIATKLACTYLFDKALKLTVYSLQRKYESTNVVPALYMHFNILCTINLKRSTLKLVLFNLPINVLIHLLNV